MHGVSMAAVWRRKTKGNLALCKIAECCTIKQQEAAGSHEQKNGIMRHDDQREARVMAGHGRPAGDGTLRTNPYGMARTRNPTLWRISQNDKMIVSFELLHLLMLLSMVSGCSSKGPGHC